MNTNRVTFLIHDPRDVDAGLISVTLTEGGEPVEFHWGGKTDEGHSYGYECYQLDAGTVTRTCGTNASDCDGPLDYESVCTCTIAELASRPAYHSAEWIGDEYREYYYTDIHGNPFMVPTFTKIHAEQRDRYAEAAGY